MTYHEEATVFSCSGDQLLGVLAKPEAPAEVGVVIIVGGPQYRVGSHRQFVLLSRSLAAAGYAVLRFDYRGMGDSAGQHHDFQAVSADIAAAIDSLQANVPSVKRVVLWGLCDGASAALLYCHDTRDARVARLCLLNPWVRSDASLARMQVKHYYLQRLAEREFWTKLFSGRVQLGALSALIRSLKAAFSGVDREQAAKSQPFQARMAQAWKSTDRSILLLLSEFDYTAKEFLEYASSSADWRAALDLPTVRRCNLPGADHTCSSADQRGLVEVRMLEWLTQARHSPGRPV